MILIEFHVWNELGGAAHRDINPDLTILNTLFHINIHRRKSSPEIINRDAGEYNNQSWPGKIWFFDEKDDDDEKTDQNVNQRQDWIAKSFVWPLDIRSFFAKHEY